MVRSKRIISWLYHASNPIREEDIHVQDRVFTLNINRETAYEWEKSQGGIYEAQAEHGDIKASMRVKDQENFILLRGSQSLGRWVGNIEYQERMEQEYARLRG